MKKQTEDNDLSYSPSRISLLFFLCPPTLHVFFGLSSYLDGIILKMFSEAAKFELIYAV